MITSMTGFGKSEIQNDDLMLSLELRTINSRFLDFSPRLPRVLIPYEDEAMKLIKEKCIRGRVTLSVKLDYMEGANNGMVLNQNKLEEYLDLVKGIQQIAQRDDLPTMGDLLRLPDIYAAENESDDEGLKIDLALYDSHVELLALRKSGVTNSAICFLREKCELL